MNKVKNNPDMQSNVVLFECPVCKSHMIKPLTARAIAHVRQKNGQIFRSGYGWQSLGCTTCGFQYITPELHEANVKAAAKAYEYAKREAIIASLHDLDGLIQFAMSYPVAGSNADKKFRDIAIAAANTLGIYVPKGAVTIDFPNGIDTKEDLVLYLLANDAASAAADPYVKQIAAETAEKFRIENLDIYDFGDEAEKE